MYFMQVQFLKWYNKVAVFELQFFISRVLHNTFAYSKTVLRWSCLEYSKLVWSNLVWVGLVLPSVLETHPIFHQ